MIVALRESVLDEKLFAGPQRILDSRAESSGPKRSLLRHELPIKPSRAGRLNLLVDRQVGMHREFQAAGALLIIGVAASDQVLARRPYR